ncbi:retrovirus-related pol polyprotein from transposon TNT 1-94 [Tanacetum coccineum]
METHKPQWKPTGRHFSLFEKYPLTRIMEPTDMPIDTTPEVPKGSLAVQIVLWYLDSGCSRHMTGDRARLINFVEKFIGTVRFGNDEYAAIVGYGDYKLGDTIISRVYYVEGLKHNLFSVGQFCDGGLEVAFRQHSCYIRNSDMVDLLKGSRTTNLYSISLNDMMSASPVCLLTKASSTKSWLWHRRLNHLNFGTLNELARNDLVRGLPMLKYDKDHLCPSCQLGKSKKASHPLKAENTNTEVLHTLHMDLCGPMRTESINGKKYVLVIVDANHNDCLVMCDDSMNVKPHQTKRLKRQPKKEWKPIKNVGKPIKRVWKPISKPVANSKPQWKPTGRHFSLFEKQVPKGSLVVQIVLWYLDSGCSRHMTGDRARLINFVEKFIGTVRFGNDEYAAIVGYGDYKLGDTIISRVYYVEGLKHNLFSVGQFCDGGLEVAFRQHSCYIRNSDMVDLLKGSRTTNLYSISLNDMMSASPVCLLTKASSTKSWLWHRRLNHLNFGTLNELARNDLVRGLPMLKYDKDHLCPSCQLGKSKKASHPLKAENTNTEVLHTLHMDLCGPMRTESINGKKYVLVIVDDYTRFGWVRFLRTKDETPQVIEKFIVKTQRALNATVRFVRTDNGTEFVNKTLDGWFESVGISHETSVPRSPQQNGVVERRNRTLMEAARTMLIFAKAPLFLWAEAVATACYTLNRSLVHTLHGKTYYELLKGKKPNLQYFRVFGSLCYPTNDYDDVGKLKAKADIGIFVGYAPTKKAYRIYNKRTRKIQETVHVASMNLTRLERQFKPSSGLPRTSTNGPSVAKQYRNDKMTELYALLQSGRSRSALVKDPEPPSVPPTKKQVDDLFQWFDDDEVVPIPPVVPITPVNVPAAPAPENANGSPSTTVISEGAPAVTESLLPHQIPLPDTSDSDVDTLFDHVDSNVFDTYNAPETDSEASSSNSVNIDVTPNNQLPHVQKWTQAHPLENIIGDKDRPVSTRKQLETDAMWCFFNEFLTHVEPKTYKQALEHSCWIEAMQEEIHEFEPRFSGERLSSEAVLILKNHLLQLLDLEAIRLFMLHNRSSMNMVILPDDVKTAFLNGELNEVVYVSQSRRLPDMDAVLKSSGCVLNYETMDLHQVKIPINCTIKVLYALCSNSVQPRAPSTLISVATSSREQG